MTMSDGRRKPEYIDLLSGKRLDFSAGPLVMGIINRTSDSFYPDSRCADAGSAILRAEEMIAAGADILDVGGESSRPGSDYIDLDEELRRVIPVIRGIRERSDIPVSVDTRKAPVAKAALEVGADMINDISALTDDADLAVLAAERGAPVVLMHKKGTPKTMQEKPEYLDPVQEIIEELSARVAAALSRGIQEDRIILDPGIGFGKRLEDNLAILRNLDAFSVLGYPLLLGASRKSFLAPVLGVEGRDRLAGTLAVHLWAALRGVDILRVHDVGETVDILRVLRAIQGGNAWIG